MIAAEILFVLFVLFYWYTTWTAVEPHYWIALCLCIPCLVLCAVSYLNCRGRLSHALSLLLSVVLIALFVLEGLGLLVYLALNAATAVTTDVGKYQRVMRITDLPQHFNCDVFPQEIPDDATDVRFLYHPAFMMGGEELALQFETGGNEINSYQRRFASEAVWTGYGPDARSDTCGIFYGTLDQFDLPEDTTVYALSAAPSEHGDWNHGKRLLTAISDSENMVLFYAEEW